MSWLENWSYRKSHTITGAPVNVSGYQKSIRVYYTSTNDSADIVSVNHKTTYRDFSDVRMADDDAVTPLNYWIERRVDIFNWSAGNGFGECSVFGVRHGLLWVSETNAAVTGNTNIVNYNLSTLTRTILWDNPANRRLTAWKSWLDPTIEELFFSGQYYDNVNARMNIMLGNINLSTGAVGVTSLSYGSTDEETIGIFANQSYIFMGGIVHGVGVGGNIWRVNRFNWSDTTNWTRVAVHQSGYEVAELCIVQSRLIALCVEFVGGLFRTEVWCLSTGNWNFAQLYASLNESCATHLGNYNDSTLYFVRTDTVTHTLHLIATQDGTNFSDYDTTIQYPPNSSSTGMSTHVSPDGRILYVMLYWGSWVQWMRTSIFTYNLETGAVHPLGCMIGGVNGQPTYAPLAEDNDAFYFGVQYPAKIYRIPDDVILHYQTPDIPASPNTKSIYLYYGGNNASSMENGSATFNNLFENFSTYGSFDTNIWAANFNVSGWPKMTQCAIETKWTSVVGEGRGGMFKKASALANVSGFRYEAKLNTSDSGISLGLYYNRSLGGLLTDFYWEPSGAKIYLTRNGNQTGVAYSMLYGFPHIFTMGFPTGGKVDGVLYNVSRGATGLVSITNISYNNSAGVLNSIVGGGWENNHIGEVEWWFVRQYVSPEPTDTAWGAEQALEDLAVNILLLIP